MYKRNQDGARARRGGGATMFDWKKIRLQELAGRTGTYGLVALVAGLVYAVSLMIVFPYERVGEFVEATASTMGYDVDVGDTKPTFGVGVKLEDVRIATRPSDGSKPTRMVIDSATVTTSPLKNLMGGLAYAIDADIFGGKLGVDVVADKDEGHGKVRLETLNLAESPLKDSLGLPVLGKLSGKLDMTLPKLHAAQADGRLEIQCEGCTIGDGKAKLKVASNPLLAEGITVPRFRLGNLEGEIVFEKGLGQIEGLASKSPDGEIQVEGTIKLADPADLSQVDLYVKFKLSESLIKSSDKFELLLQFAEGQGKRSDGFYGFRLQGSPRRMRDPQWMKSSPFPPKPQRRAPKPKAAAADLPKPTQG